MLFAAYKNKGQGPNDIRAAMAEGFVKNADKYHLSPQFWFL